MGCFRCHGHKRNEVDRRRKLRAFIVIFFCVVFGLATLCFASNFGDSVNEVENDAQDARSLPNKLLKQKSRFVLIPIPVANPTLGTGLALTAIYIHAGDEESSTEKSTTSGVVGLVTDKDSWAFGAFHDGYYYDDTVRIRGTSAYGEFNLDFYGTGNDSIFRDNPVSYKSDVFAFMPRVLFELPADSWFLGGQFTYLSVDNSFDFSNLLPGLPEIRDTTKTGGLGPVLVYDSRDNNLWPSQGTWLEATASIYGKALGGDFDYRKTVVKFAQYFPLHDTVTGVYRIDGGFVGGDAPFYDLSYIRLRGFQSTRFLDDNAFTAQAEIRWNCYNRWHLLAFGGGGVAAGNLGDLTSASEKWAGGGGFRYMIDEKRKLSVGVDAAYGDDETQIYIQIGDWLAN